MTLDHAALGELVAGAESVEAHLKKGAIAGEAVAALGRIFSAIDLTQAPVNLVVR